MEKITTIGLDIAKHVVKPGYIPDRCSETCPTLSR